MSALRRVGLKVLSVGLAALTVPLILYVGAFMFPFEPLNFAPVGDFHLSIAFVAIVWGYAAIIMILIGLPTWEVFEHVRALRKTRSLGFAVLSLVISAIFAFLITDSGRGGIIFGGLAFVAALTAWLIYSWLAKKGDAAQQ